MSVQKIFKITNLPKIIKEAEVAVNLRKKEKIKKIPPELPIQLKRKDLLPIISVLAPEIEVSPVKRIIREVDFQAIEKGKDAILALGEIAKNRADDEENDFDSIGLSDLLETAGIPVPESIEIQEQKKLGDFFNALGYPSSFITLWIEGLEGHQSFYQILSPLEYINLCMRADGDTRAKLIKGFSFLTEEWKEKFLNFDEIYKLSLAGIIQKVDPDFYRKSILPWLKGEKEDK
jgi:hypothetical protein